MAAEAVEGTTTGKSTRTRLFRKNKNTAVPPAASVDSSPREGATRVPPRPEQAARDDAEPEGEEGDVADLQRYLDARQAATVAGKNKPSSKLTLLGSFDHQARTESKESSKIRLFKRKEPAAPTVTPSSPRTSPAAGSREVSQPVAGHPHSAAAPSDAAKAKHDESGEPKIEKPARLHSPMSSKDSGESGTRVRLYFKKSAPAPERVSCESADRKEQSRTSNAAVVAPAAGAAAPEKEKAKEKIRLFPKKAAAGAPEGESRGAGSAAPLAVETGVDDDWRGPVVTWVGASGPNFADQELQQREQSMAGEGDSYLAACFEGLNDLARDVCGLSHENVRSRGRLTDIAHERHAASARGTRVSSVLAPPPGDQGEAECEREADGTAPPMKRGGGDATTIVPEEMPVIAAKNEDDLLEVDKPAGEEFRDVYSSLLEDVETPEDSEIESLLRSGRRETYVASSRSERQIEELHITGHIPIPRPPSTMQAPPRPLALPASPRSSPRSWKSPRSSPRSSPEMNLNENEADAAGTRTKPPLRPQPPPSSPSDGATTPALRPKALPQAPKKGPPRPAAEGESAQAGHAEEERGERSDVEQIEKHLTAKARTAEVSHCGEWFWVLGVSCGCLRPLTSSEPWRMQRGVAPGAPGATNKAEQEEQEGPSSSSSQTHQINQGEIMSTSSNAVAHEVPRMRASLHVIRSSAAEILGQLGEGFSSLAEDFNGGVKRDIERASVYWERAGDAMPDESEAVAAAARGGPAPSTPNRRADGKIRLWSRTAASPRPSEPRPAGGATTVVEAAAKKVAPAPARAAQGEVEKAKAKRASGEGRSMTAKNLETKERRGDDFFIGHLESPGPGQREPLTAEDIEFLMNTSPEDMLLLTGGVSPKAKRNKGGGAKTASRSPSAKKSKESETKDEEQKEQPREKIRLFPPKSSRAADGVNDPSVSKAEKSEPSAAEGQAAESKGKNPLSFTTVLDHAEVKERLDNLKNDFHTIRTSFSRQLREDVTNLLEHPVWTKFDDHQQEQEDTHAEDHPMTDAAAVEEEGQRPPRRRSSFLDHPEVAERWENFNNDFHEVRKSLSKSIRDSVTAAWQHEIWKQEIDVLGALLDRDDQDPAGGAQERAEEIEKAVGSSERRSERRSKASPPLGPDIKPKPKVRLHTRGTSKTEASEAAEDVVKEKQVVQREDTEEDTVAASRISSGSSGPPPPSRQRSSKSVEQKEEPRQRKSLADSLGELAESGEVSERLRNFKEDLMELRRSLFQALSDDFTRLIKAPERKEEATAPERDDGSRGKSVSPGEGKDRKPKVRLRRKSSELGGEQRQGEEQAQQGEGENKKQEAPRASAAEVKDKVEMSIAKRDPIFAAAAADDEPKMTKPKSSPRSLPPLRRTEGDESNNPARGAAPAEAAEEQMRTPRTSPRGLPQRTSSPDEAKMKPRDAPRSRSPASSKKVTLNRMSHQEQQAQALRELLDSKVRKLLPEKLPHSKAYRHKQPIRPSAAENVNAERRSSRSSGGRISGGRGSSTLEVDEFLEAELKQQREELQRSRNTADAARSVELSSDLKSSSAPSARSGSFIDDLMRRHAPGSEVAASQRKISDAPPARAGTTGSAAGAPGSRTSAETSTKKKSEQLLLPSSIYEEGSGESMSIPAMVITEKARSQSALDRRPAADALDPADEDTLRITTISNYRRSAGVVEAGSRRLSSRLSPKDRKFLSTQREQRVHDRATWRSERRGRRSPEDHRSRSSKRTSEGGGEDVDTSELDEDIRSLLARGEKENKPRKSERMSSSGGGSADLLQVAHAEEEEEEEEDQAQPPRRSPSTEQLLQTAERQSRQLQEVLDRIAEQQEALRQSQQQEHQERASGNKSAAGGAGGLAGRAYSGTRGPSLSLDEHLQGSEPEHDIAGRASLRRSFPANDWRAPQLESISIGGGGGPEVVGSSDPGGGDLEPDRRGYPSIAMPRLSSHDAPVAPPSDSLLPGGPAGPVAKVPSMMVVDAVPKLPSMMVVDAVAKVPSVMVTDHSAYGLPAGGDEGNNYNVQDEQLQTVLPDWAESMAKAEAQLVAARKQLPSSQRNRTAPGGAQGRVRRYNHVAPRIDTGRNNYRGQEPGNGGGYRGRSPAAKLPPVKIFGHPPSAQKIGRNLFSKDTPKKVVPSGYTRARTAERASKDPRPMTRNVAALDHLHFHPEDHLHDFHFKREGPPPAPQKQRAQPKTSATAAIQSHPLRGLLTPRGFARGEAYLRSLTPKQHQNPVDYDLNGRRVEVGHVDGNSKKPRRVMQWPHNDSELGPSRPGPKFPLRASRDEPDSRPRTPRSARDLEGNVIREVAPAWSRHFGARGAPIEHGGMLSSSSPFDLYKYKRIRGGGAPARSTTPRSGTTPRRNGDPTAATASPGRIMNRVNMLEGKRRGRTKTPGRPMRVESAAPKTLNAERKQRLSIGMPGGQLEMLSPDRATETDEGGSPTQETNDVGGVFVFPGARLVAPGERSKSLAGSQAGDAAARASENKEENSDAALENDDIAAAGYGNSNSATDVVDALRSDAVAPLLLEEDDAASATPSTPVSATGGENEDVEKERKQVISSPMNTISTRPSAAADNYFSLSSPDVSPQMSHAMPRDDEVNNDDQDDRTESSKHSHFHELSSSEEEEELPQGADVGAGASAEREEMLEKDVFVDPEQGQGTDVPQPDEAQSDPDASGDGDEDLQLENGPIVVLAPKLAPRKAPARISVKRNRSPSVKAEEHHASVHHEDDVQFADHDTPPKEKVGSSFPGIEPQPSEYRGSGVARRSSKKDLAEQVQLESEDLPGVPSGKAPKKTKASKTPLISRLSDTTTGNQPRREQKSRAAPSERESVNGRNSGSSASKKKLSTTAGDRPSRSTAVRPGSDSRSGSGTSSSQQAAVSVPKARGLAKQDKSHADFKALPRGRRVSNSSAAENETGGQSPRPEFWSQQLSPRGVFTPKHQYKDDLAKFRLSSMRSPRGLSSKSPPPLSKSTSVGGAPIAVAPALSSSRRGSRAASGRRGGSAPEVVLHHSAADMGHTDDGICHQACFMADEHLIQQHHDRHDFVHGGGDRSSTSAAAEDERSMASLLEIRLKEENDQLNAATQGTSAQVHRDTHVEEKRALDSILAQENANLQLSLMGDQELVQLEKSVRTQSSSIQLHEKDEDSRGVTDVSPRGAADLDAGGGTPEKQISGTSSSSGGSGASGLSAEEASSIRDKFVETSTPEAAFPETAAGAHESNARPSKRPSSTMQTFKDARRDTANFDAPVRPSKRFSETSAPERASEQVASEGAEVAEHEADKKPDADAVDDSDDLEDSAAEANETRVPNRRRKSVAERIAARRLATKKAHGPTTYSYDHDRVNLTPRGQDEESKDIGQAPARRSMNDFSVARRDSADHVVESPGDRKKREAREAAEAEAKRLQEENELELASLRIQSRYRGGKARAATEDKKQRLAREKEAKRRVEEETRELVYASLKIQSRYRGGKARTAAEDKKQSLAREEREREAEAKRLQEEKELVYASLKIQSRYRGGKARAVAEEKKQRVEAEAKRLQEEEARLELERQAQMAEAKRLQKEAERLEQERLAQEREAEAKRLQEQKELEEASLKIQSRYRGGKARAAADDYKKLKERLEREKQERAAEAKRLQEEQERLEHERQAREAEAQRLQEEEERLERERQAREAEAQRLQEQEEERLEREAQEREAAEAKRLEEQQELENSMSLKIQSRYRGGKARADVEDKRKALERERKEADEAKRLKEEQEARKQARQARWAEEKRLQKEESERLKREKQEQADAEAKRALQERKELEEASLKIQSRYRGGKARAEAQGRKQDLLSAAKRDEPLQEVEELEKSRVSAAEAASASPDTGAASDLQLDPDRSAQEGREYLSMGGAAVAEEQETQDEKGKEKPAPPLIPRLPLLSSGVYAANKDVGPMKEPHITQAEELEVDHLEASASQQERTSVSEETAAAVRIQRRHRASVAERLRERRKRGGVEAHMTHAVQVLSGFSPRGYAPAPAPAVEDAGVLELELEVNYEKMASTSSTDELSDIETVIELSILVQKKVIELVHLEDVRTMVHGYEGKTRVGGLGRILRSKPDKNWVLLEIKRTGEKAWLPGWCVSKGFFKAVKGCEKGVCDAGDIIEYLKGPVDGRCQVRNVTKRSNRPQWLSLSCLPPEAGDQHKSPSDKKEPVRFFAYHDYKSKDGKVDLKKGAELQVVSVDPEKGGWVKVLFLDGDAVAGAAAGNTSSGKSKKGLVPYWVMPHELRPKDLGKQVQHAQKMKRALEAMKQKNSTAP